ncbi:MAG TPA: hypothetical protein VML91_18315 [Burkholderiales bacterium]|nr:hypothetical protein [Burkholderiales bacterium]
MQRLLALLLAPLVFALCACEQASPPEPAARPELATPPEPPTRAEPAVQIEQAAFGVFNRTPDGRVDFKPTKTVPLTPNQEFGWVIGVTTSKPTVRWREEFTVPTPPETWGPTEGKHEISADRKVSILEREVTPERGFLFNAWTIAPGDPKGHHVIRVTVEDAPPVVFEFDIE